jgi:DNA-binding MarR family transcriptional regulator
MGERFLKSIRLLAECMQGYERLSGEYVRRSGLTHPQFDIIATLGNTSGMSYKELGDKTLITKGTLTGVIERLEQKGLVERQRSDCDKRSFFVRLTKEGERVFCTVFPHVIAESGKAFAAYSDDDFADLEKTLSKLKTVIMAGATGYPSTPDPTKEII